MKSFHIGLIVVAFILSIFSHAFAADSEGTVTGQSDPSGIGIIDRIDRDSGEIVIDDYLYFVSNGTKFYSTDGVMKNPSYFVTGLTVQYLVDDNKNLLALWEVGMEDQIVRSEGQDELPIENRVITPSSSAGGSSDGGVKLEDGVWTN